MSSTTRVLLGLAAGLVGGMLASALGDAIAEQVAAFVTPLGTLWLNALRMTVVPLVVSLVVVGIADASSAAAAGRVTGLALGLFAILLCLVGISAALLVPGLYALLPVDPSGRFAATANAGASLAGTAPPTLADQVASLLPVNVIAAASEGAMVPIVLFALVFGFAVTRIATTHRRRLVELFRGIADAMLVIVGWVLRAAPVGVFALVLPVAARSGSALLGAAGIYVLGQSLIKIAILVAMYPVAVWLGGLPLRRFALAAAPAQGVGFSTQSSLASLPIMLDTATRKLDLPPRVAGVVLPLAVSLFRVTSPANTVGAAIFVATLYGMHLAPLQLAAGVLVAVVVSLSAISLPGQASFASTQIPVMLAMGVPIEIAGLLLALDTIPDAFRTAANVTGDLAVTAVVARRARDTAPAPAASVELAPIAGAAEPGRSP